MKLILMLLLTGMTARAQAITVESFLRSGDSAYAALRTLDAVSWYNRAARLSPDDYRVLTSLARSWCDLGRLTLRVSDSSEVYYRRSVGYAERLVSLYPDSVSSWFLLALCHGSLAPFKSITEKLNIARDVEKNALRALAIDSTYGMTYVLLGIYYREASGLSWMERTIANSILGKDILGTLEGSEQKLRTALRLSDKNSYAWFELGVTLTRMERDAEAMGAFERCRALPVRNEREAQQNRQADSRLARLRSARAR